MGASRGIRGLLVSLVIAGAGCRGCLCTNITKSVAQTAPKEDVERVAREELARSPEELSTICGVRVSALKDMVVSVVESKWARHTVRVQGTAVPILDDAGAMTTDDDDDDTGARRIVPSPAKAILCIGVVILTIEPILDEHGNGNGWHATSEEIESVATAGVLFEKAKHEHHHHHHHHH